MIIDSHGHVSTAKFDGDRADVLARAWAAGLEALVDVGCTVESSEASVALAQTDPRIFAAVGVHPHDAKTWDATTKGRLVELTKRPRVVAIGETGLDFHYDHSPRDVQRAVFREQLRLARELDLPVVLHVREAYDEALGILDEEGATPGQGTLRGLAHCFTGTRDQALGFVRRGFGVSFSGVVTFKNATDIQEAAKAVPLELLLVETDCPYMAPVPHRGQRCEPRHVVDTAAFIAKLKGVAPAEVMAATVATTRRILGLASR
jgi:TatD DNase family protein